MKKILLISLLILLTSCSINDKSMDNSANAQSFLDNIITNPEKAKSLLHDDFTFAWMGIIEEGGKIWNKENRDTFDIVNKYFLVSNELLLK